MPTFKQRITSAYSDEQARRKQSGEPALKKKDLWTAAKRSSGAVSHWFNGTNDADLDACMKVAPLLGVNPFWLFDESTTRQAAQKSEQVLPSTVTILKPPTERDKWNEELTTLASQLDLARLGMLVKEARALRAEMPAKQTPTSSQ